jgi:hypothetical protein
VWVAGITNIIAKTMKMVSQEQEEREREREVTARTDGGRWEVSQHTDTTREEGQEERQQPQQLLKPRPKLKLELNPKPEPVPKPKSAPTPTPETWWETVPPRAKRQRAPVVSSSGPRPGPAPTA